MEVLLAWSFSNSCFWILKKYLGGDFKWCSPWNCFWYYLTYTTGCPTVYSGAGELISRDSRCYEPLFFPWYLQGPSKALQEYFIPRFSEWQHLTDASFSDNLSWSRPEASDICIWTADQKVGSSENPAQLICLVVINEEQSGSSVTCFAGHILALTSVLFCKKTRKQSKSEIVNHIWPPQHHIIKIQHERWVFSAMKTNT